MEMIRLYSVQVVTRIAAIWMTGGGVSMASGRVHGAGGGGAGAVGDRHRTRNRPSGRGGDRHFLSAEVHRATSSAVSDPYGRIRASRKLPPNTSPRYCDHESSVP